MTGFEWLILFLVQMTLMLLLAPKPKFQNAKAQSLKEADFPTAEDRPIPYIAGRVMQKAPNCTWYGDLKTVAIKQKVKTNPFGNHKNVTVGHKYYLGLALSLGFGPLALHKIRLGTKTIFSNGQGVAAGVHSSTNGAFTFLDGSSDQAACQYLVDQIDASPESGVTSVVFHDRLYLGEALALKALEFEVSRYPGIPGLDPSYNNISGDANPACVMYELYTSSLVGATIGDSFLDLTTFRAAAIDCYNEDQGISLNIGSISEVGDIIDEIKRHIDAYTYTDLTTGKLCVALVRDDYTVGSLYELNPDNVAKISSYSRGSIETKYTDVRVSYRDRFQNYTDRLIYAQNLGVQRSRGTSEATVIEYPFFRRAAVASRAAWRELRRFSYDPAALTVEMSPDVITSIHPGQPVKLNWPEYDISSQVFRVASIDIGRIDAGKVAVSLMQDLYGMAMTTFDSGSEWQPVDRDALDLTNAFIFELPPFMSAGELTYPSFVAADPGGVNDGFVANAERGYFATSFVVNEAVGAGDGTIVCDADADVQLLDRTFDAVRDGSTLAVIASGAYGAYEVVGVKRIVREVPSGRLLVDVVRGLGHSVPGSHAAGVRMYMLDDLLELDPVTAAQLITVDAATMSIDGEAGTTVQHSGAVEVLVDVPYPVNSLAAVYDDPTQTISVNFSHPDVRDKVLRLPGDGVTSSGHVFNCTIVDGTGELYSGTTSDGGSIDTSGFVRTAAGATFKVTAQLNGTDALSVSVVL